MPGSRTPAWRRYLRFWGQNLGADIDDELRFHLDMRTEEQIRRGVSPPQARSQALQRFGDLERVRLDCTRIGRERVRAERRRLAVSDLRHDLVFAFRVLRRQRLPAVVIVLCLALGIGATTTVFSVGDALLLRPPPYPNGSRLVSVGTLRPSSGGMTVSSFEDFADWAARQRTFAALGAIRRETYAIVTDDATRLGTGARVTSGVFRALGIRALHGRLFGSGDDRPGAPTVAVVTAGVADRILGGAARAVGSRLRLDDRTLDVVGVIDDAAAYPDGVGIWTSMPRAPMPQERNSRSFEIIGALREDVTLDAARRDLAAAAAAVARDNPDADRRVSATAMPLRDRYVGAGRPAFLAIAAAALLLLLIACANVASLQLARASARVREIAVRTALGAARGRVLRLLLVESVILAVLGGALGVLLARVSTGVVAGSVPMDVASWMAPAIDGRVLAFTVLVSIASGIAFGLAPALKLAAVPPARMLQSNARAGLDRRRLAVQRGLVVAEIALSLVLLVGAAMAAESFSRLSRVNAGFDAASVVSFRLSMRGQRYEAPGARVRLADEVVRGLAALPGVEAVAGASHVPIADCCSRFGLTVGEPFSPERSTMVTGSVVTPGYFRALRIDLMRGRVFSETDRDGAPPVMVINETFERQFFKGADAVGKIVHEGTTDVIVVGVVRDVKQTSLMDGPEPQFYMPQAQKAWEALTFVIRGEQGSAVIEEARRLVKQIDPTLPIYRALPLTELMNRAVMSQRMFRTLLRGFAVVALVLATAGIYGVTSYWVAQRMSEMGIRVALGAPRARLLGQVLRQAAALVLLGTALGLVGAFGAARGLAGLLYGVRAEEPLLYAVGATVLAVTAVVASLGPARRATAVDPAVVLRAE
jgi:predicted permease